MNEVCRIMLERLRGWAMQSREVNRWEHHFGAVTQAVVVALLIWTGTTLIALREQVAVMEVKVTSLQGTVSADRLDGYRSADAQRDFSSVHADVDRLEKRVDKLEAKVDKLEMKSGR